VKHALLLLLCCSARALAEEPEPEPPPPPPVTADTAAAVLADAQARLAEAAYAEAAALAGRVAAADVPVAYRAEAARVRGLSLFFTGDRGGAEAALLQYLRLVPDAHLDPALVAPDAVVFFEEVRTRHAGELLVLRPRPERRRYWVLNLLPPFGQFQNGDRVRGWVLAGAEVALLAANVTTYVLLRSSCAGDLTCGGDPSTNRTLQTINVASGIVLAATWAVGVVDGFIGYKREQDQHRWQVGVVPTYVYIRHSF
jgi:hypothetical protein